MFAPIALFCYNRLDCLKQTVEALQANELAAKSDLFIFSDGPKPKDDSAAVYGVRAYLKSITGFRSIHIKEAETNQGLANSIIAGVTEVVNRFGRIIVLEDDLVTAPFFLRFMNEALDFYEGKEKVAGIHGWRPMNNIPAPDTFFTNEVGCWGWATWKRGWDLFERDGNKLLKQFTSQAQIEKFNIFNSYPFYQMLKDQVAGKVDSWAIRWYASVFLKGRLGLQPGKNMIKNIGFNSGTHFSQGNTSIPVDILSVAKPEILEIELNINEDVLKDIYTRQYRLEFPSTSAVSLRKKICRFVAHGIKTILPYGLVLYIQNRKSIVK